MRRSTFWFAIGLGVAACRAFGSDGEDTPSTADAGALDGGASSSGGAIEAGPAYDSGPDPDAAVTADFPSKVRAIPGLLAYWRLDDVGSGVAKDPIGGNDGVYKGGVGSAPGTLGDGEGKAADFPVNTAVGVDVTKHEALATFDQAVTVGAIVRPRSTSGDRMVVQKFNAFLLGFSATRPIFEVSQMGNGPSRVAATGSVESGARAFLVGTSDGVAQSIWVNGALGAKVAVKVPMAPTGDGVCIGAAAFSGAIEPACSLYFFDGIIDEVFLANRPISEEVIKDLARTAGF